MDDWIKQLNDLLSSTHKVDLSYTLQEGMPAWPTQARFGSIVYESYDYGDASIHAQITMSEHTGTHIDAPRHFFKNGLSIDELPVDTVLGRGIKIDASHLQPNEILPLRFVKDFEKQHGEIQQGDIILFRFGWEDRFRLQPDAGSFLKDWPGLGEEVSRYLLQKKVNAVGTDAMSLDAYDARVNICHHVLLGNGIPILENVCNLKKLPEIFFVMGLPHKFKGGSGSPLRLVAFVADE